MSFTYNGGANPQIDYPRFLVADTVATNHIFEDSEILAAIQIELGVFQSSMFYSGSAGQAIPQLPIPWRRVAATLLDSVAANKARLAGIQMMLDVKVDASKAAAALQNQAEIYRKTEDESGAFFIIEQVNDYFSFADRFWKQVQRQSGA